MRSSLQQSAKSAKRGSEAFPWQNKTLIKTQSTVCSMQRASSSEPALIWLISAVQWAATVSESIALAGKNCPHSSLLQYWMSSTQSFHGLGETLCEPGAIKQQRLLKATHCEKNKAPCVTFTLYTLKVIFYNNANQHPNKGSVCIVAKDKRGWDKLCLQIQKQGNNQHFYLNNTLHSNSEGWSLWMQQTSR